MSLQLVTTILSSLYWHLTTKLSPLHYHYYSVTWSLYCHYTFCLHSSQRPRAVPGSQDDSTQSHVRRTRRHHHHHSRPNHPPPLLFQSGWVRIPLQPSQETLGLCRRRHEEEGDERWSAWRRDGSTLAGTVPQRKAEVVTGRKWGAGEGREWREETGRTGVLVKASNFDYSVCQTICRRWP